MRLAVPILHALLWSSLGSCQTVELRGRIGPEDPERALDWTLGVWQGVRRAASDGSEQPMEMRVRAVLGGAGQTREIEIPHGAGVYRGFCLQVYDPSIDRWRRTYVNDVRRSFAVLEGEVLEDRSVWRSVTPGRVRESRLVSERPAADRWRRTMSVSEDGGATWRELWIDELRRVGDGE